jgi:hypothetical protein
MTLRDQAEQALTEARQEIEALRAQVPDEATISAYNALVEYLTTPSQLESGRGEEGRVSKDRILCREKSPRIAVRGLYSFHSRITRS